MSPLVALTMSDYGNKPLFIIFSNLGLGGVQRKIVDLVNYLQKTNSQLNVYILLREKGEFDLSRDIENKRLGVIHYLDWFSIKIPFFFPIFVLYQVWQLKPRAILAFLDLCSLSAIWTKLLLFWRDLRVVISEDHYTSRVVSTYKFASIREFLIKIFYPFADKIFVCSHANKKDLMKYYKISSEKIAIIRNWTNFKRRKTENIKYDLIYTGRLVKTKNLEFLLKTLKRLKKYKKNIKLCLVGDGEERGNLESYILKNDLKENVIFLGLRDDVQSLLSQAKIFVLTSQLRAEGLPLSVLEAMAVGTPVLSRDFAGVREFLEDGKNCYLFKKEEEFIKKTIELLKDAKKRKRIEEEARNYVAKNHSSKNIRVYLEALGL